MPHAACLAINRPSASPNASGRTREVPSVPVVVVVVVAVTFTPVPHPRVAPSVLGTDLRLRPSGLPARWPGRHLRPRRLPLDLGLRCGLVPLGRHVFPERRMDGGGRPRHGRFDLLARNRSLRLALRLRIGPQNDDPAQHQPGNDEGTDQRPSPAREPPPPDGRGLPTMLTCHDMEGYRPHHNRNSPTKHTTDTNDRIPPQRSPRRPTPEHSAPSRLLSAYAAPQPTKPQATRPTTTRTLPTRSQTTDRPNPNRPPIEKRSREAPATLISGRRPPGARTHRTRATTNHPARPPDRLQ